MSYYNDEERLAADVLKTIARSQAVKEYVQQSPNLYPLLFAAARRFVTGETVEDALRAADYLSAGGYRVSLEYIGENTTDIAACREAKTTFLRLIEEVGRRQADATVSFDLSHIGLSIDPGLAESHLLEMAEAANKQGVTLMISMEESTKTEQILRLYQKMAFLYTNIGITIQAHLHRSQEDLTHLLSLPGRIRIVKGAYKEPPEVALPRGEGVNQRYLELVERCTAARHPISIATHDAHLIQVIEQKGYAHLPFVEMEMLYGIQPELSKQLREKGVKLRIYLTYGTEWYLYLCHRLAEHPPNLFVALADMQDPTRTAEIPY
ncbi:proline dehydrogenase family protein [Brevibacillus humidisoli]|uniref:proline dehydrogenase family protein n=1 Tax=Brevibacillus humidisoli TaxID=2895522 RepID=UPI001E57DD50|nr:proline dehydrogenase family protein [Brevibacillus humidisoli]UFJ39870.1 proline dehydrogenase family protein [Brevibacillus humidisoli]